MTDPAGLHPCWVRRVSRAGSARQINVGFYPTSKHRLIVGQTLGTRQFLVTDESNGSHNATITLFNRHLFIPHTELGQPSACVCVLFHFHPEHGWSFTTNHGHDHSQDSGRWRTFVIPLDAMMMKPINNSGFQLFLLSLSLPLSPSNDDFLQCPTSSRTFLDSNPRSCFRFHLVPLLAVLLSCIPPRRRRRSFPQCLTSLVVGHIGRYCNPSSTGSLFQEPTTPVVNDTNDVVYPPLFVGPSGPYIFFLGIADNETKVSVARVITNRCASSTQDVQVGCFLDCLAIQDCILCCCCCCCWR